VFFVDFRSLSLAMTIVLSRNWLAPTVVSIIKNVATFGGHYIRNGNTRLHYAIAMQFTQRQWGF
jgi:hypothetical protein